jgi:AraC family transcriptional regulator of arabinose operon
MARTQIYIDHSRDIASDHIYVPAMGVHELMPPGLIRHGGPGSDFPCLIMFFHNRAWSLALDRSDWLPCERRLIIWGPEAAHQYGNSDKSWDHSWLHISGGWIERTLRHTQIPLGVPIDIRDTLPLRYFQMISDELRGNVRQDPEMLEGFMQLFWHDMERHITTGPGTRSPDPRMERARRFIETHFAGPFNLAEVAGQAHLSPSHFCSLFSRQFGAPPREYAMRLRLQRGAQLLANHDLAVFQVADMVGFPDALYFSRLFRKRYGVSPMEFRRHQRKASSSDRLNRTSKSK